jgi:hypothetical protein
MRLLALLVACIVPALWSGVAEARGPRKGGASADGRAKAQGLSPNGTDGTRAIRIERTPDGRAVDVDLNLVADAPLDVVARMVADIERWPAWVPGMLRTAWVEGGRRADGSREFVALVYLPFPLRNVQEGLLLRGVPPHAEAAAQGDPKLRGTGPATAPVVISWEHIRGDLKRNEGRFTLSAEGARHTRVACHMTVQLSAWVPTFLVRAASVNAAPHMIANLRARAAILGGTADAGLIRPGAKLN